MSFIPPNPIPLGARSKSGYKGAIISTWLIPESFSTQSLFKKLWPWIWITWDGLSFFPTWNMHTADINLTLRERLFSANTSKAGATTPLRVLCAEVQLPRRTSVMSLSSAVLQGCYNTLMAGLAPDRLINKILGAALLNTNPWKSSSSRTGNYNKILSWFRCVVLALLFAKWGLRQ